MKKILLTSVLLVGLTPNIYAESLAKIAKDIAIKKIEVDGEAEKIRAGKTAEVSAENSDLDIKTNIENGAAIGNTGIIAVGEKVNLDHAKIKVDTKVKNGAMVGNSGVVLGAHK